MKKLAIYMLLLGLGKASAQQHILEDRTVKPAIAASGKPTWIN